MVGCAGSGFVFVRCRRDGVRVCSTSRRGVNRCRSVEAVSRFGKLVGVVVERGGV